MKQKTHAWIAVRAVALLEDSGKAGDLLEILKPHVKEAAIGAWLPDLSDTFRGFGKKQNHILKMKPYAGKLKERFVLEKKDLYKQLGSARLTAKYLNNKDEYLDKNWWKRPYKADPPPGKHLANRAMAFSTAITDLIIIGDEEVDEIVPGEISFIDSLSDDSRTREAQLAIYFFMMSHFVADSCMPCHCDARPISSYSGIHKDLEARWNNRVSDYFDDAALKASNAPSDTILDEARNVDTEFDLNLPSTVPKLKNKDVWYEVMSISRGSFALANIIAPIKKYGFSSNKRPSLNAIYPDADNNEFLAEMDEIIIHDAVLNTAIVWKHIFDQFD